MVGATPAGVFLRILYLATDGGEMVNGWKRGVLMIGLMAVAAWAYQLSQYALIPDPPPVAMPKPPRPPVMAL